MTETAERFTVQSWNLWFGGARVQNGREKVIATAKAYSADILALQECAFENAADATREVGLNHTQQDWDNAVAARFPVQLVETATAPFATAAIVTLPQGREILQWSVHLAPWDYGPYDALKGASEKTVHSLADERKRLHQITAVLAETERILSEQGDMPVIIAGDFNSPATLDWSQRDDRPEMSWPSTDAVLEAGFQDAFRTIHPDAAAVPADTWSPIEPLETEPRDRIDFIFSRGLTPVAAMIRGVTVEGIDHEGFAEVPGTCALIPDHSLNAYPSDHQMVEVTFDVSGSA